MTWLTPHYVKAACAIFVIDSAILALSYYQPIPAWTGIPIFYILNAPALPLIFAYIALLHNTDISPGIALCQNASVVLVSGLVWAFPVSGLFNRRKNDFKRYHYRIAMAYAANANSKKHARNANRINTRAF